MQQKRRSDFEMKARRAGTIVTPHRAGQGTQPREGVGLITATEHGFEEVDQIPNTYVKVGLNPNPLMLFFV